MSPFVVALVITLKAYPGYPAIQVATFETERDCEQGHEEALANLNKLYPLSKLLKKHPEIIYTWTCKHVRT